MTVAGTGYSFLPAGDCALTVEFGDHIDDVFMERVQRLDAVLADRRPEGVIETIPTYRSLQILYDPTVIGFAALERAVAALIDAAPDARADAARTVRTWTVPVAYGGDHGIDLEATAGRLGMTPDGLADAHAACVLTVAMIGFQPGFTYLSGLPERLHVSRQETPRRLTPAGSVSVGGVQAAISSVAAPSAWNLLGQTPVRAFDLRRDAPFLFRPGDRVRFRRIDRDEFGDLAARIAAGETVVAPVEEARDGA